MLSPRATKKVREMAEKNWSVKDIAHATGYSRAQISEAVYGESMRRAELRGEMNRLLKRCPRDRDPAEHERIVRMNFADC